MKKEISFLIIILIIFSSISISFADEDSDINEDPVDEVFDVLKRYYSNIDDLENEITKYKSANYYLDIKTYSSLFDPIKKLVSNVNSINNLLFGLNKMISKITIFILLFSYEFDLYELLSEYIDLIMNALRVPIYDRNILTIIAFIGLYSIIATAFGDRKTTVLNNAIRAIIITLIAVIFLNSPSSYLTKVNDFSKGVSNELFQSTYGRYEAVKNNSEIREIDSDQALVSAGGMIWDIMVHKPWQALVLGKTTDEELTGEILKYDPYDDERIDKISDLSEDNSLLRLSGIFPRFGALLLFMIFNMVLAVIISMVSGLSVMAQALVIILSFAAPFILLLSLIPRFTNILGTWGLRVCGYGCIKIAISFFLSILLVVCGAIYASVDENGLIVTLILMAVIAFAIYHSRKKFVDIIKSMPRGERAVRREIKNPSQAMEKVKDYKSIVTGYSKEKMTGAAVVAAGEISRKTKDLKEVPKSIYDKKQHQRYRNMAYEYLERNYEKDREKAELKADRLGRDDAAYSSFVKDVDMREKLGQNKFTESQINSVIKVIRKIETQGEDPNKFINGEIEGINKNENIDKKIAVKGHGVKLSNKEILNRVGALEKQIKSRNQSMDDLSHEERSNELFENYRLWQEKFEYMNIIQDRKIQNNKKSFSRFNEYKDLEGVRNEVNKEIKEMASIFKDDFKGDRIAAFNEKLNIQVDLRKREDELIKTLEGKSELSSIRERAAAKESSILSKFDIDRIRNKDMLLHEDQEYKNQLKVLKNLYNLEDRKTQDLQKKGINVRDLNMELRKELNIKGKDDVESLLLARADMNIYDDKYTDVFKGKDRKTDVDAYVIDKSRSNTSNTPDGTGSEKVNDKQSAGDIPIRKTSIKGSQGHSELDIEKLINRDDEILHELQKSSEGSNKGQTVKIEGEHIERLGEEIAKNIDTNLGGQITSSSVQNIKQDIIIQNAKKLNSQFGEEFNLDNNQIFFESLIKKYGEEAVKTELSGMKNNSDIKNPKGLLISRLKYNHKQKDS